MKQPLNLPGMAQPIDPILPEITDVLAVHGRAILQAPPGAGKTTRVPLALLAAGALGRIVMLQPRRIAARAAAERLAAQLREEVGGTVGYAIRGEAKISRATRIEVVTEGILTRRLQSDPGLAGIGTLIFDEFHERALQADLGLALAWEVRGALRPDLRLLVMSATLDAAPVAALLDDAPVLTSRGRAFPVDTIWLAKPLPPRPWIAEATAKLVLEALAETEGGVLVFLPGAADIRRCAAALTPQLPPGCVLRPLYGALPGPDQRAAIAPDPVARKIVLATAIAETSLTIEDIRVVVDAGRARRARFDQASGMSRLVTERVTRAEADQRRGRAGRIAPGTCYRLWSRGEDGALSGYPPAEIEVADLTGLALDLAQWGASADDLAFLTPPPAPALREARALLQGLGALDAAGRITAHGTVLAAMPLHPRLGHMLAVAGRQAAPLAALLSDRDPLRGMAGADLELRLKAMHGAPPQHADRAALARIRAEAKRLARQAGPATDTMTPGEMAALAYPDRIALRRPGEAPRYLLSGGKGAVLDPDDPLAGQRLLVATDLDGNPRDARIRQAATIAETALRALFAGRIETHRCATWSRRDRRVTARIQERLGALILSDRPWPDAPSEALAEAMLEGVRELGLSALARTPACALLRARLRIARVERPDLPDPSEAALLATADTWLLPFLGGLRTAPDLAAFDPAPALLAALSHDQRTVLDRIAPPAYTTPLGRRIAIDYAGEAPEIRLRLQEMFGETRHPQVGGQPLRVTLLSPRGQPLQTTMDLPGFWAGSYADVRRDMRARYPKHPWPEDPRAAAPTLRAKPRR